MSWHPCENVRIIIKEQVNLQDDIAQRLHRVKATMVSKEAPPAQK